MESDPIGLTGGMNTYGYVNGNPLRYSDALGLVDWLIVIGDKSGMGTGAGNNFVRAANTRAADFRAAGYSVFKGSVSLEISTI